jgi:hypothetical protein
MANVLAATIFTSSAIAQHSDVLVTAVNGQVAIGSAADVDGPNENFDVTTKTFESVLLAGFSPVNPADYEGEEPGYFALNAIGDAAELTNLGASALPNGADVSISASVFSVGGASASLFYWDGVGAVNFQPAAAGTTFAFDPATNFATTDANGGMDDHPIYELEAAAGTPVDGVYLVSPRIDVAGLARSDNFYLVLLADALIADEDAAELVEEALESLAEGTATDALVDFGNGAMKDFAFYEEAVEFVADNVVVPEPGTALLLFSAIACLVSNRTRSER